jgi:hypothetical protein
MIRSVGQAGALALVQSGSAERRRSTPEESVHVTSGGGDKTEPGPVCTTVPAHRALLRGRATSAAERTLTAASAAEQPASR